MESLSLAAPVALKCDIIEKTRGSSLTLLVPPSQETLTMFSPTGGTLSEEPRFVEPIQNVTIAAGRDVKLSCVVDNLGTYKVSPFPVPC